MKRHTRKEEADLSPWCQDNSLLMNVTKTKELIVDCRRAQEQKNNGTGVHITEDFTWSTHTTHTDTLARKARQHLYHLRQVKKFRVSLRVLQSFYSGAAENILTGSIAAWFGNSSAQDRRALQRVVELHSPPCRTSTPGGAEREPVGS